MINVSGVVRVTRVDEIRAVGNSQVIKFGVVHNRRIKKNGEWTEKPVFMDCETWDRTAEFVSQWVKKGNLVSIAGEIDMDSWEDKSGGGKRSKLFARLDRVEFGPSSRSDGESRQQTSEPAGDTTSGDDTPDNEIPF